MRVALPRWSWGRDFAERRGEQPLGRGWTDPRVVGGFVLAALLFPVFFWRAWTSTRPVMDCSLFKVRQFRLTNAATELFSTAFFGMLLANVIFLQTQWHYSILMAALASAPGPLLVTAAACPPASLPAASATARCFSRALLRGPSDQLLWPSPWAGRRIGCRTYTSSDLALD